MDNPATHQPEIQLLQFDQWCLLEIMGHQRYAGRVTEQTIAGQSFLRIDIPAIDEIVAHTKYFGASSVYAINPIPQDVAVALASKIRAQPVEIWDFPDELREKLTAPRIASPVSEDQDLDTFDEDDDDDHAF